MRDIHWLREAEDEFADIARQEQSRLAIFPSIGLIVARKIEFQAPRCKEIA